MKQWFLIEKFIDGSENITPIDGNGMPFALKEKWMELSDEEKSKRSSFEAIFCEVDENGNPNLAKIERRVQRL